MNDINLEPMTSIKELRTKINEINELIYETIISENSETSPITDGIIDVDKYFSAEHKILWILKEPYDDFDDKGEPCGGGWGLDEAINSKKTIHEFKGSRQTFTPMIYTSWGILNEFCLWGNMRNIEDDPEMLDALKSIAYINVKKLPGHTTSHHSVIENAYHKHKVILLKQIEYYEPDIIIGGSTLHNFFKDLGFTGDEMQKHGSVNFIIKDKQIFIDAYHPAQRPGTTGVSQEQYCNDIITTVNIFKSTIN